MEQMQIRKTSVLAVSSFFGVGYLPFAPGTWGSLAAIPLWWFFSHFSWLIFLGLTLLLTVVAIWISNQADFYNKSHDAGSIVIDEVVGMLFAAFALPFTWKTVFLVFVGFRFFDILKPPPIRMIDRQVGGGLGVVFDDVVAGIMANIVVHLVCWLGGSALCT